MSKNSTTLKNIGFEKIIEIDIKAFSEGKKCRMTLAQIGEKFISTCWNVPTNDFDIIRNRYILETEDNDPPKGNYDFYKYIAKKYLNLEKEPMQLTMHFFYKASDDIKEINSHLKDINNKLKGLEEKKKNKGWLDGEDRYYRNLLEYYKEKNESAKSEILKFISEDIEHYALSRCYANKSFFDATPLSFFMGDLPYRYSRGVIARTHFDSYNVNNITELSNKFLELQSNDYMDVKKLYHDDKEEFYSLVREYMHTGFYGSEGVIDKIRNYIKTNHIVARRKDIIERIITHYNSKDFISVVNILPMQIEGIFHDICIEVGIDESKLDISSINEKLRIIQDKVNEFGFFYFEYYSFKFPVIRNAVAHGKIIDKDIEQTAIMLILDLLPVCELATYENIPTIKKIKLAKEILAGKFDSFQEYILLNEVKVPGFYSMDENIKKVDEKYKTSELWGYIEGEVRKLKVNEIENSKIMKFVKMVSGKKLCGNKSKKFFESMPSLIEDMKEKELKHKNRIALLFQKHKKINRDENNT